MSDSFPVRVGVNAVVADNDRVLAVKFDDHTGSHYNLPGGGVESGERIPDALIREVKEETTAEITVGQLLFVHEYFPPSHDNEYGAVHKLTLFFACEFAGSTPPALPEDPDPNQIGVEWLPVDTIGQQPLLPDLGDTWEEIVDADPPARYLDHG